MSEEKDFLNVNLDLSNDFEKLDKEITEIDNLFIELKTHYDGLKDKSGTLTFLEKQAINLVTLKKIKLDALKQKSELKKSIAEFELKKKFKKISNEEDGNKRDYFVEMYNSINSAINNKKKISIFDVEKKLKQKIKEEV